VAGNSKASTKKIFPRRMPYGAAEVSEVTEALRSQNLFCMNGTKVNALQTRFARKYGTKFAVAATSGTAAIHLAIGALNPEPGSEIVTAPVTDFGTIAGILFQGCVPVFTDWKPGTFNVDPASIEDRITDRTAAILPVHLFGNPCDMDAIMKISRKHRLPVIEDCCQAYCTTYKGKLVGTIGDIGCFSMQASKHLSAGEGGITITGSEEYAMRMELFRDKGWESRGKWGARAYAFLGLNYRMNELTGAVALAQLAKVDRVVAKRRELGGLLTGLLSGIPSIAPAPVTRGGAHSYWLYPLRVIRGDAEAFAKALIGMGLPCGWGYTVKPIYLCTEALTQKRTFGTSGYPFRSQFYDREIEYKPGLCPVAERELLETITVSLHEGWTRKDVRDAAAMIRKAARDMLPWEKPRTEPRRRSRPSP
jgi:perosamine synthetase